MALLLIKRNLIANYLGQAWTAIIGLAFIPLYIKILGIESYGLIGLFGVLQVWLGLLDVGMTPTLSREMARFSSGIHSPKFIRDLLRSIEIIALVIAVTIIFFIALSADLITTAWLRAEELPAPVVSQALLIMGVVIGLRFLESIYRSSVSGMQLQVVLNIVSAFLSTVRALGAVGVLMWFSASLNAFFIWQGLATLLSLIVMAFITYRNLPKASRSGEFSMGAIRSIWRFAGGMVGITFLGLLLTSVDKVILSKLLTLSEYGYYTLASVVAGALYMLIGPITNAFYPQLCQLNALGNDKGFATTYHKGAQLISVVVGSAAIVMILNAEIFLNLWTQNSELSSKTAPLLSLLTTGNLLNALMWMPYQAQLAHGWTKLGMIINAIAVTVSLPAIFLATSSHGAIGAAVIWIALNACYCIIGIHFMYRKILKNEKWRWYRQDIFYPILAAFTVAFFIKYFLPSPIGNLNQLFTLAFSFTMTLIAAIFAANEVRRFVFENN